MTLVDYSIVVVYLLAMITVGIYFQRKASGSIESYFLGKRGIPWWALGASGMAHFFDMTGTMIIVSFLFLLGPRGLFLPPIPAG